MKTFANHSDHLKLDLQFFGEEEDFILPDDSVEPVETELESDTTLEEVEETTETEETEVPTQEEVEAFLKVKYNKEEIALDQERARELAQKGLNYDKVQEKLLALESDPRLSFIEELASERGMSTEEFIEAFQQQREQQRLNELVQQNIPEDIAKEILENRKFRQQYETKQKEEQTNQQRQQELQEFISAFPDAKPEEIPQEVWDAHANGTPLKYAYMQHEFNQLKNQLKVHKQNESNTKKAPVGSVTSHGSTEVASEDDFLKGFNSI